MVAGLCHFVISFFRLFARRYGAAPKRNNAKRKDEITKQKSPRKKKNKQKKHTKIRNNARRKVETTKLKRRQAKRRNNERRQAKRRKVRVYYFAWRFSSFRARFSLYAWRIFYFAFSPGVFCLFVILSGVFSLFRLFTWRYFVLPPRHIARRKDKNIYEMAQTSPHTAHIN